MKHIPYLLIVGENEVNEGTVSIRKQGEGDQGSMKIADFAKKINDEVAEMTKTINFAAENRKKNKMRCLAIAFCFLH